MSAVELGPYYDRNTAISVAQTFANLGETVKIGECYEPYQKKSRRYSWFVIREASA